MARRDLHCIAYSPWSQIAAWSLKYHDLKFRRIPYQPLLSEPLLRLKTKRLSGRMSVPVLITDQGALFQTLDIVHHADAQGGHSKLVRSEDDTRWFHEAIALVEAARDRVVINISNDTAALDEATRILPAGPFRPLLRPVGKAIAKHVGRKYPSKADVDSNAILKRFRDRLGDEDYLDSNGLSLGSMAMAVVFDGINPPSDDYVRRGPATRLAWFDKELASAFGDLVAWRDRVYAEYHPRRPSARR